MSDERNAQAQRPGKDIRERDAPKSIVFIAAVLHITRMRNYTFGGRIASGPMRLERDGWLGAASGHFRDVRDDGRRGTHSGPSNAKG